MESLVRSIQRFVRFFVEFALKFIFATFYRLTYYVVELPSAKFGTIRVTESGVFLQTGLWCIFATSLNNRPSNNLVTFLMCLKQVGYNVLLINNGQRSDELVKILLPQCHSVVTRPYGGRDFGSYKCGTKMLREMNQEIQQIIYCNDSIFIRPSTLQQLLERIKQLNQDYIGITETYANSYHVQSWFFALSGRLFNSADFQRFWLSYKPMSYRLHCISNGEIGVSTHLSKSGIHPHSLYTQSMVVSLIFNGTLTEALERLLMLYGPQEFAGLRDTIRQMTFGEIGNERTAHDFLKREVMESLGRSNTMNAANLVLLDLTEFPFLKKDLVYRGQYMITQIDYTVGRWVGDDAKQVEEILSYVHSRGSLWWQYSFRAFLGRIGIF